MAKIIINIDENGDMQIATDTDFSVIEVLGLLRFAEDIVIQGKSLENAPPKEPEQTKEE